MMNSLLIISSLPSNKKSSTTSYELWFNKKPNIGYFNVWSCLSYTRTHDIEVSKLGPKNP